MTKKQVVEREKLEGELRWVVDKVEKTIVESIFDEMDFFANLEKKEASSKKAQEDFSMKLQEKQQLAEK